MFQTHGLNVARQPDNASNPRPDNRSGWLSGETPDVIGEHLNPSSRRFGGSPGSPLPPGAAGATGGTPQLAIRLWDPSRQLRYRAKRLVPPRPDGASNRSARGLAAR